MKRSEIREKTFSINSVPVLLRVRCSMLMEDLNLERDGKGGLPSWEKVA